MAFFGDIIDGPEFVLFLRCRVKFWTGLVYYHLFKNERLFL
jgi:hypothetical protein